MAHEPEKKAEVIADLIKGMSINQAAKKHGVPVQTVGNWSIEMGKNGITQTNEARLERFQNAVLKCVEAVAEMTQSHTELLADHEYLRKQSTDDIIRLTDSVFERVAKLVDIARGAPRPSVGSSKPAGPAALPDVVEPDGD